MLKLWKLKLKYLLRWQKLFRNGNFGVMDYYKMMNIKADTAMRETIGGKPSEDKKESL